MKNFKICFFAFLFFSSLFLYKNVFADTIIDINNSIISTNTTWTKAAGPYLVHDGPIIQPGATLTIESGTIINVDPGEYIDVLGSLVANGTSDDEIYFTTSSAGNNWGGIEILDGGSYHISNTDISHADTGFYSESASGSIDYTNISNCNVAVDASESTIHITNSIFSNISWNVLNLSFGSSIFIDSSSIINTGQYGIEVGSASNLDFENSTIDGIQANEEAVDVRDGSYAKIVHSVIKNAGIGIESYENSSADFIDSSMENINDAYSSAFAVYNDSTLNISSSTANGLYGEYALEAFNNSVMKISNSLLENFHGYYAFDIFSDDSYGTSTLEITSSKINHGDKYGIFAYQRANINLKNTQVTNFWEDGILTYGFPNIQITDSIFSGNYYGIESYGANISISNSTIKNNDNYGIYNNGSPLTSAENNWWGDISGPLNNAQNASGTANQVSNNVNFIPWLSVEPIFSLVADTGTTTDDTSTSTATTTDATSTPPTSTSTTTATTTDATSTPPIATSTAKTPVIIIPGIMGSYLNRDYGDKSEIWPSIGNLLLSITDHFLDDLVLNFDGSENIEYPMKPGDIIRKTTVGILGLNYTSDTFDGLIQELTGSGYEEGKDLFVFPYDWRKDNAENAGLLKNKIDEILATTSSAKIDVVAHSMGGLLAKSYIAQNGTSTIDKIIFIGTPHLGAPKAYKALMYGDDMGIRKIISFLYPPEVKIISQNMPGVFELLPSKKYVNTNSNNYIYDGINKKDWLSFDETENFMASSGRNNLMFSISDSLHDSIDDLNLENLDSFNFSGCGTTKTIGQIITIEKKNGEQDYKILYVNGDETVPLVSSDVKAGDNYYVTGYGHSALPSAGGIKQDILSILQNNSTTENFTNISTSSDICLVSGKAISVHSPVSLDVYDGNNNHTGIASDGKIEYGVNGVSFDEINGEKFAFLPSGIDYKVILNGESSGIFDFYIEDVSGNDKVSNQKSWLSVPIESTSSKFEINIASSSSPIINVDEDGDGIFEDNLSSGYDGSSGTPITELNTVKHGNRKILSINPSAISGELVINTPVTERFSRFLSNTTVYEIATRTSPIIAKIATKTTAKIAKKPQIKNKLIAKNTVQFKNDNTVIPNIATVYDSHATGFLKRAWQSIINFFKKIL